jgi:hypothetical protein
MRLESGKAGSSRLENRVMKSPSPLIGTGLKRSLRTVFAQLSQIIFFAAPAGFWKQL